MAKIRVYLDGDWPAFSLDVSVTVTYRTDAGVLRAVRKTSQLPLKTVLRSCPPESTASFVTVVKSDAPPLAFTQLFPGRTRVFLFSFFLFLQKRSFSIFFLTQ